MSDVIENLAGTRLFDCQRISLAPLMDYLACRATSIPEDPRRAFSTTKYGLFMSIRFRDQFLSELQRRPSEFLKKEGSLFVWTLKVAARWREAVKDVTNMKQPLPWYIPPLCAEWQQSGDVSSFIPGEGALFLMSGKTATQKPVSFRVDNAFRHPIWEFDIFEPTEEPCHQGQVFLSIDT